MFILFSAIPAYAVEDTKSTTEHIFTNAELAGAATVDTSNMLLTSDGFIPINQIENKDTRASTPYYIAEMNDGYLLTSPTSGTFSKTRYSAGNSNSHNLQKWIFTEISTGVYVVYSNTDTSKCLTVNPSTRQVTLAAYSGSQYQKWRMYYSGNGNALQSEATDTAVSGYKLVIGSSSCSVSNTTYTPVGFIDVSWYIPCTSLSFPATYINAGDRKYIYPTHTPEDSNVNSSNWTIYTTSSSSVFTIDTEGRLTAVDAGSATLTIRDKITRVYNTAKVYVTRLPNPDAQNKSMWCWAASAKMVGEHNGGSGALGTGGTVLANTVGIHSYGGEEFYGETYSGTITADAGQRQIVVAVKGSDANNSGDNSEKEEALELAALDSVTVSSLGNGRSGLTAANKTTMNNDLNSGLWIIGNVFTNDDDWSGHSVVIRSYNSSTQVYTFWDPWTNTIGTFTKTQLDNSTIHTVSSTTNRVLAWIQRCY